MIILADNTTYTIKDNLDEYLPLQSIANKTISDLLSNSGNGLLVYPHSFYRCEDETDKQSLLNLQLHWKENQCTEAILNTGNIAGFINVNGQSLSIHSRFATDTKQDFFLHYMLQKVLRINLVNMLHETTDEQAFDFLLLLFPKLLNEALTQGIYKEYQRNEYNDANVRGTIDINMHLKTNLPFNGRIAYRTREFSHDNHVTELIRHTIDYIGKTSFGKMLLENDADTHTSVAQIIHSTPHYNRQEREKIVKANLKVITHPYYSSYTPLQKLCLRILKHEKNKYGAKDDKIHGVLFDVSYLWEEYLATILSKQGFKHPNNKRGTGRIYLALPNQFPRYPDFYREKGSVIADAKYKRNIDTRDDVNQMITYLYRLKAQKGVFILPTNKVRTKERYHLYGYGEEANAELQKYFFLVPQDVTDFKTFAKEISKSENKIGETEL